MLTGGAGRFSTEHCEYASKILVRVGRNDPDPFGPLGLHPFLCSAQDVRMSFRRLAIDVHPDKRHGGRCPSGCAHDFSDLVDTRDRALRMIEERPPPWQWIVWIACTFLSRDTAQTIEIPLDVDLCDLHRAVVKKVCIRVNRTPQTQLVLRKSRQTLYVRLICPNRDRLIERVDFPGKGDDPPSEVFIGLMTGGSGASFGAHSRRGDVTVRVRITDHPIYCPDPVLSPCDLHARAAVSLLGYYAGERVVLPHPSGDPAKSIDAHFDACACASACACTCVRDADSAETLDDDRDTLRDGRVVVIQGMGLPFLSEDGEIARGALYIFMRVVLPALSDRQVRQLRLFLTLTGVSDTNK